MVWKCCGKALAFGHMEMGAAIAQVVGFGRSCDYKSRAEGGWDTGKGHLFSLFLILLFTGIVSCVSDNALPDKT